MIVAVVTRCRLGPVIGLLVSLVACSKSSPELKGRLEAPSPSPDIAGKHAVVGQVPVVNGMPSIVILEPNEPREFPHQEKEPVMDQISLTFTPEVLFVRTGQPVQFWNSDDTLHNINVREDVTKAQPFNVAIPTGATYGFTFKRDGFYSVRCDIHSGMTAQIISTSSPYAAQTDASGRFAFEDVEAGPYTVIVYAGPHKMEKTITVAGPRTEATVGAP